MTQQLPDWTGGSAAILASGPSLTSADVDQVREWRASSPMRFVITINTTFRLAPWADVLYACDDQWWTIYGDEAAASSSSEFWSITPGGARRAGVRLMRGIDHRGLSRQPGLIHTGANSGYQAIGLAYQFGVKRAVLLGYDMEATGGRTHHHGDHPGLLHEVPNYEHWRANFHRLAPDLVESGMVVVNASRSSLLTAFPRVSLEEALQ